MVGHKRKVIYRRCVIAHEQLDLGYWTLVADNSRTEGSSAVIADGWCQTAYLHPRIPVIHSFGLTDPFGREPKCAPIDRATNMGSFRWQTISCSSAAGTDFDAVLLTRRSPMATMHPDGSSLISRSSGRSN